MELTASYIAAFTYTKSTIAMAGGFPALTTITVLAMEFQSRMADASAALDSSAAARNTIIFLMRASFALQGAFRDGPACWGFLSEFSFFSAEEDRSRQCPNSGGTDQRES